MGLVIALVVSGVAMFPAQWLVACLILAVLAMPAILIVEPALKMLRSNPDLPRS
ncbi:MAG: hypothetical protein OXR62_07350 [Ahrensia sp.]|nr:hypothetical protein [Ahrensia sp.]